MTQLLLEMREIVKEFPGVAALDHVGLTLHEGECLALVGENGAGKSTLMKILSGAYEMDAGTVLVRGKDVELGNPSKARTQGIAIIYQEFNLIPYLSVTENIWLGREPLTASGVIDSARMLSEVRELLGRLGTAINPLTEVRRLTTGEQQLVEIARAIHQRSEILIMDEPTASLTQKEIETLFDVIRNLKKHGAGIIYISHRLQEIFEVADRVMVLRDGKNAGECEICHASVDSITQMMIGRVGQKFVKRPCPLGPVLLTVENATSPGKFSDISFEVHAGETVGLYGIAGAGQIPLARSLFGLERKIGRFVLNGKAVTLDTPNAAMSRGLGLLTENRKEEGLLLKMSVGENISLSVLDLISQRGYIPSRRENSIISKYMSGLNIKTAGPQQLVKFLSGGNQQKVLFARSLTKEPSVLVLCEPTRGIDVGAKVEIYELISRLAETGKGLILVSSELPEVLAMCDRVIVLYRGAVTGDLCGSSITEDRVLRCALGSGEVN